MKEEVSGMMAGFVVPHGIWFEYGPSGNCSTNCSFAGDTQPRLLWRRLSNCFTRQMNVIQEYFFFFKMKSVINIVMAESYLLLCQAT